MLWSLIVSIPDLCSLSYFYNFITYVRILRNGSYANAFMLKEWFFAVSTKISWADQLSKDYYCISLGCKDARNGTEFRLIYFIIRVLTATKCRLLFIVCWSSQNVSAVNRVDLTGHEQSDLCRSSPIWVHTVCLYADVSNNMQQTTLADDSSCTMFRGRQRVYCYFMINDALLHWKVFSIGCHNLLDKHLHYMSNQHFVVV